MDFLGTSGAYAAVAFVGGALVRRQRWSFVSGLALQVAAFIGYYLAWDWTAGAPGAVSWGLVGVVTAPVTGWLGHLWRSGRRWIIAAPLGLIVSDSVTQLISVSFAADPASRFAGPIGGLVVVAVTLVLVADGPPRHRLRLVLLTVAAAAVVFAAFVFVVDPAVQLVFLDCGNSACPPGAVTWPAWPDVDGDGYAG